MIVYWFFLIPYSIWDIPLYKTVSLHSLRANEKCDSMTRNFVLLPKRPDWSSSLYLSLGGFRLFHVVGSHGTLHLCLRRGIYYTKESHRPLVLGGTSVPSHLVSIWCLVILVPLCCIVMDSVGWSILSTVSLLWLLSVLFGGMAPWIPTLVRLMLVPSPIPCFRLVLAPFLSVSVLLCLFGSPSLLMVNFCYYLPFGFPIVWVLGILVSASEAGFMRRSRHHHLTL